MITFNIIGCCILRDIFRINKCDDKFKVNKFVQSISPIAFMEEPQNQNRLSIEDLSCFTEWGNFNKRNICYNFNKNVLKTIEENPSDYLLIDLSELRFHNDKITLKNGESFTITRTKFTSTLCEDLKKIDALQNIESIEEVVFDDEYVFKVIDKYIAFFKQHYDESKIIVVENYMKCRHLNDDSNNFYEFHQPTYNTINIKLKKYYDHLKTILINANYIQMPHYTLGDAGHAWGKDPLHFVDDYYEYLFKAIDIIINGESKNKLGELYNNYSIYFKLLEKQKKMAYYINSLGNNNLLPSQTCFNAGGGWKHSLSKTSKFNLENNTLSCGDEPTPWAILSQNVELNQYLGKTLCFSVKYQTFNNSTLNLVLRYKTNDGKWVYHSTKQVYSDEVENVDSLISKIPETIPEYNESVVCIYLSKPNQSAKIIETKLEYGEHSSLF